MTVGTGRDWSELSWEEVTFPGFAGPPPEAGNCLLGGGKAIHWLGGGTLTTPSLKIL